MRPRSDTVSGPCLAAVIFGFLRPGGDLIAPSGCEPTKCPPPGKQLFAFYASVQGACREWDLHLPHGLDADLGVDFVLAHHHGDGAETFDDRTDIRADAG